MADKKKSFFQERTISEIRDMETSRVNHQRDLVERIDDLDPTKDALIIMARIIPNRFFKGGKTGEEASRLCYKHGEFIALPQPETLDQSLRSKEIPMDLRIQAFFQAFNKENKEKVVRKRQEEINYVGMSWRPLFGRVRTKTLIPFRDIDQGVRLFSYAENFSSYRQGGTDKLGIKVDIYPDAKRVKIEGASAVVTVPSTSEKKPRYRLGLAHIPVIPTNPEEKINYNLSIALSLRPFLLRDELTEEPVVGRTPFSDYLIQYKQEESREGSDALHLSPIEVAGMLGVMKRSLTENHNYTPLEFNVFPLPSKHRAEFYLKLLNNILVFDPTLTSKDKLRKPHLAEKSIIIGRGIYYFGTNDFAFWNPSRDGIYKNFDWSVPKSNSIE